MNNISFEFDIKLKKVAHRDKTKSDQEFLNIPNLRKYLLLAHQIAQVNEGSSDISAKRLADWLGVTRPRINQITALLCLCPKIQEEILLMGDGKINSIKEYSLRPITREIDWQKQLSLWQSLVK